MTVRARRIRAPRLLGLLTCAGPALLAPLGPVRAEAPAGEGGKAAVFAAEMNDPSLAYGRKPVPAEQKRLALVTDELRKALSDKAGLASVDLAPQQEEIAKQAPLWKCNGCASDIAKALGAGYAVTTTVEKGAGQIFNLDVAIADSATGKVVRSGLVVIRANTDDDWTHAMRWVVKNRLLTEPLPGRS
ncbi:DUF3280 domain-containing protein [Methylobacterium organophilum]|uniref:DUF2380 domain-containing protein n=1 Tax=Methylobacterium organophilum TaxID=410 RepID=A0ABQ4TB04_METOR|nr:DUF3280 domain-containing protein [Methylobacterium organophilum]GJE27310.1 hypothetical protein LKMONMHP_2168 [Methylobacterium organophilum]